MEEENKSKKNSPNLVDIAGTKIILEQMMNYICKIKINDGFGTGFFCKIPFMNSSMKVLMTNCHVLDNIIYIQNKELSLFINDDKEVKNIKIELDRKTYFNKKYDIAIIELKESDNIYNFLELDDNLFKNEAKIYYKDISVYILQYPLGKKSSVSYGKLIDIDNYEIKHICNTMPGSSGSPILNLSNNKVIGIHKQGSQIFNFNKGTFLKYPLENCIELTKSDTPTFNNLSKIISDVKNEFAMEDLITDMKNIMKSSPIMTLIFQTKKEGHTFNLKVSYGTTIDQLLKYYLKRMNRAELIGNDNKIIFLFNAAKLEFGDKTPVEEYFKYSLVPKIFVNLINDQSLFSNWTKEQEELLKREEDKMTNDNYLKIMYEPQYEQKLDQNIDNKKETSVNFNEKGTKTKIRLSIHYLFAGPSLLSLPDISKLITDKEKDKSYDLFFYYSLPKVSQCITDNDINMSGLFSNCPKLKSIPDISNWKISNIKEKGLFYNCASLTSFPDISKWNTESITDMSALFCNCSSLSSLPDISNWNTKNVINISLIFCNCSSLYSLSDLSKWNTGKVTDMGSAFYNCSSLLSLPDISTCNINQVINMTEMFYNCYSLPFLPDISKWKINKVNNINNMCKIFAYYSPIVILPDISNWNKNNINNIESMFYCCSSLSSIPNILKRFYENGSNNNQVFYDCFLLLALSDKNRLNSYFKEFIVLLLSFK